MSPDVLTIHLTLWVYLVNLYLLEQRAASCEKMPLGCRPLRRMVKRIQVYDTVEVCSSWAVLSGLVSLMVAMDFDKACEALCKNGRESVTCGNTAKFSRDYVGWRTSARKW